MNLHPDRFFSPDNTTRKIARELYETARGLPIVSPHGHVDPKLFCDDTVRFGSPAELFILPDHYVTRMFFSQGISYDQLGIGSAKGAEEAQLNLPAHRDIWKIFCENFHLFRGTPSGIWLKQELVEVFGLNETPSGTNADPLFDQLTTLINSPEYSPRALFERFQIEVLATTDAAYDSLAAHQTIRTSGWNGNIIPTFRPDSVINLDHSDWRKNIAQLEHTSGVEITTYANFIHTLENRREFFKSMGAVATDHSALSARTIHLSENEAAQIFERALHGQSDPGDAEVFTAHMLMEMARMSCEDGLVMQLHPGVKRNLHLVIWKRYGPDRGFDIPVAAEFALNLQPLLNRFGSHPNFSLILFTLDETTYARELAPLAGAYPAVKLGPPWWFNDSVNGMARFFDQVMETAGVYNTAGFNDDTRAFCSIPARHDVWRRTSANWLAGLVVRHFISQTEACEMIKLLAVDLAKIAYRLA